MTSYEFAKKIYLLFGESFNINQIATDKKLTQEWISYVDDWYIQTKRYSSSKSGGVTYVSFTEIFYNKMNEDI